MNIYTKEKKDFVWFFMLIISILGPVAFLTDSVGFLPSWLNYLLGALLLINLVAIFIGLFNPKSK